MPDSSEKEDNDFNKIDLYLDKDFIKIKDILNFISSKKFLNIKKLGFYLKKNVSVLSIVLEKMDRKDISFTLKKFNVQ